MRSLSPTLFGSPVVAHNSSRPKKLIEAMRRVRVVLCIVLATFVCGGAWAQVLKARPVAPAQQSTPVPQPSEMEKAISLTVPVGTPVKVSLDREVRLRSVGQALHGRVVEPLYAFDRLVVPAGTEVLGRVAAIEGVSKKDRVASAINANFSPSRKIGVVFDLLVLPDGRRVSMQTSASQTSNGVLQFVPAGSGQKQSKVDAGKNMASREIGELRHAVKQEWDNTKKQLHEPGKMHRIQRYAVAQLPYHPQYMDPGTCFNADLNRPLDFGSEALRPEKLSAIGSPPPSGSIVHALLVTPLNSASSKKKDPVEAVISQPLVVSDRLFIPQGSRLKGSVLQVRPARWFHRSGQLRIVFREVVPPGGVQQKVDASIEGVEVAQGEHLSLDSEGGAQVTAPRTRYLTTGISVVLASSSVGDADRGKLRNRDGGGDVGSGAANGGSGFRLLGTLAGAFAHSRVVSSGLGFYGAAMSVYSHFLSHGREVVYPKDMSLVVGFGARDGAGSKAPMVQSQ
jgi:hypothetical protein